MRVQALASGGGYPVTQDLGGRMVVGVHVSAPSQLFCWYPLLTMTGTVMPSPTGNLQRTTVWE
jgi:hypothetical protein